MMSWKSWFFQNFILLVLTVPIFCRPRRHHDAMRNFVGGRNSFRLPCCFVDIFCSTVCFDKGQRNFISNDITDTYPRSGVFKTQQKTLHDDYNRIKREINLDQIFKLISTESSVYETRQKGNLFLPAHNNRQKRSTDNIHENFKSGTFCQQVKNRHYSKKNQKDYIPEGSLANLITAGDVDIPTT